MGLVRAALALLVGVLLAAAGAVVAVFAVEMLTDPSGGDRAGVAIVIGLPIFLIVVRVTTSVLLDRVARDDDRRALADPRGNASTPVPDPQESSHRDDADGSIQGLTGGVSRRRRMRRDVIRVAAGMAAAARAAPSPSSDRHETLIESEGDGPCGSA